MKKFSFIPFALLEKDGETFFLGPIEPKGAMTLPQRVSGVKSIVEQLLVANRSLAVRVLSSKKAEEYSCEDSIEHGIGNRQARDTCWQHRRECLLLRDSLNKVENITCCLSDSIYEWPGNDEIHLLVPPDGLSGDLLHSIFKQTGYSSTPNFAYLGSSIELSDKRQNEIYESLVTNVVAKIIRNELTPNFAGALTVYPIIDHIRTYIESKDSKITKEHVLKLLANTDDQMVAFGAMISAPFEHKSDVKKVLSGLWVNWVEKNDEEKKKSFIVAFAVLSRLLDFEDIESIKKWHESIFNIIKSDWGLWKSRVLEVYESQKKIRQGAIDSINKSDGTSMSDTKYWIYLLEMASFDNEIEGDEVDQWEDAKKALEREEIKKWVDLGDEFRTNVYEFALKKVGSEQW